MNSAVILSLLFTIATEVGVDPGLAQAVALQENPQFIPDLVAGPNDNGTYDYGIMGLNSAYIDYFAARYWDKEEVFDWKIPEHNIYVGLRHLKYLISIPGWNAWTALVAYNAGESSVRSGSPPDVSIEYANRIFIRWQKGKIK